MWIYLRQKATNFPRPAKRNPNRFHSLSSAQLSGGHFRASIVLINYFNLTTWALRKDNFLQPTNRPIGRQWSVVDRPEKIDHELKRLTRKKWRLAVVVAMFRHLSTYLLGCLTTVHLGCDKPVNAFEIIENLLLLSEFVLFMCFGWAELGWSAGCSIDWPVVKPRHIGPDHVYINFILFLLKLVVIYLYKNVV